MIDVGRYYKNKQIIFPKKEDLEPGEVFANISEKVVPGIRPLYMVSTRGRIFNKYSGKFMNPHIKNGNNYATIQLSTIYGFRNLTVHRLVLLTFLPNKNSDELYVNHKDGIKYNNRLSNLEWVTAKENTNHAISIGLMDPVHTSATIDDNTVIQICELLQENKYSNKEIADIVGNNVTVSMVGHIKNRECWTDISSNYNFYLSPKHLFTPEMVENICKYLSTHNKGELSNLDHYRNALKYYGYDSSDRYAKTVDKIVNANYYSDISSKYTFI